MTAQKEILDLGSLQSNVKKALSIQPVKKFNNNQKLNHLSTTKEAAQNTIKLARQLKTQVESQVHYFIKGAPQRGDDKITQLTAEDIIKTEPQFESEEYFIDMALRAIMTQKDFDFVDVEQLLHLRDQFQRFDKNTIDETTFKSDPIVQQFWHEHNIKFNNKLDFRKYKNPLYPIRSVYIRYMRDIISKSNSAMAKTLVQRFENEDALE